MTYPIFSLRLLSRFVAGSIALFRTNPPGIRLFIHAFCISTILVTAGCGKSPTPAPTSGLRRSTLNPQPSTTPAFRLHWLGKKRLSAESNATNFISIWNMPESLRLESQTLDKLSTAPWRLLTTSVPLSNAPSALLRPLLDDLVQEEIYLEIEATTNNPTQAVFAIKLPPDRLALWQSNLPIILKSLSAQPDVTLAQRKGEGLGVRDSGEVAVNPSADYQLSTKNHQLTLTHSGDWLVLSVSSTINHQPLALPPPFALESPPPGFLMFVRQQTSGSMVA